jgi:hypothetical protein
LKSITSRLLDLLQRYEEAAGSGSAPDLSTFHVDADLLPVFLEAVEHLERWRVRDALSSSDQKTLVFTSSSPTVPVRQAADPPGYRLEEKIGEGGMGVVYRAVQVRGRRTVALKMLRPGAEAGARALVRFQTEAEAVARLQHPNIVQVFEIGESAGVPFFSMEFCAGGSLEQRLARETLKPADAATLVRTLALAMQAAHEAHILHRDLKPGNVLLTADGTPKITDFGLAKKLDEASTTLTGDVMGTPSYMPPEQAMGRKDLGPAVDIYALGAILYACLTGRPPFRAATSTETLLQALRTEPVPPRQLNPSVPRDLETIVHKCLQKDPSRRYASARALAEDLGRYLEGRPILARPVGTLERAVRWCWRNPALAAALTAAVVFLVGGAATASWFAVDASWQAGQARQNEAAAVQASNKLKQKNEELERTLARTWLSPLARRAGPLTEPEAAALGQVALQRGQPPAQRFLHEALTDPTLTPQLGARAEYVWQAALGLDRERRQEAEQALLVELRATGRDARQRGDLALAAGMLGDLSPETANLSAVALTRALAETRDAEVPRRLAVGLAAVAERLEPGVAVGTLIQALSQTTDLVAQRSLASGLPAALAGLEPEDAVGRLTGALSKKNTLALRYLAQNLSRVVARLEPSRAAGVLLSAMESLTDPYALQDLAQGVAATSARLPPSAAARVSAQAAARLAETATRTPNVFAMRILARGLEAVAARMEASEAACLVTDIMSRTSDPLTLQFLAAGMAGAAGRLEPKEATRKCAPAIEVLIRALGNSADPAAQQSVTQALTLVTARLDPREVATLLTEALDSASDSGAPRSLAVALAAAVTRLEPAEAERVRGQAAAVLLHALESAKTPPAMHALAGGLAVVTARLERKEARRLCGQAAGVLSGALSTTGVAGLAPLAQGLAALAPRLEPAEARRLCDRASAEIVPAISKMLDPATLRALAEALAGVAAQLEKTDAAQRCGEAAGVLVQVMSNTAEPTPLQELSLGLTAVMARMDPHAAAELLLPAMGQTRNPGALQALARGLATVSARLEPTEAARACRQAAGYLTQTLTNTTTPAANQALAGGLATLSTRLEPREASTTLLQAVSKTTDPLALQALALGLGAVANRLSPDEAARVCGQAASVLTQAMSNTTPGALPPLALGLLAVAAWLEPAEAVPMLIHALSKITDPFGVQSLGLGLTASLHHESTASLRQRHGSAAGLVAVRSAPLSALAAPALMRHALQPPPPLPAQTLVDLLKHPLCVGEVRRVVLAELSRHYDRPFLDQWDFVNFVEEQRLGLDLLSPAGSRP